MHTLVGYTGFGCLLLFTLACGSTGSPTPGTGGSAGAGTGGSAGTGGGATGGSSPGSGGTGGGGTGGTIDSGGPMITKAYTFDTDVEGWTVTYTGSAVGITPLLPGDIMLSHNATDGQPLMPTPGSIEVIIPYNSKSQYVGIGLLLAAPPATGLDLTGKLVTARVKIVSGLQDPTELPNAPAGAKIYAKSVPGYVYANGAYTNLTAVGQWIPVLPFDPMIPSFKDVANDAGTWDPASVYEIGLQIDTSGMATTAQPAVVRIDTLQY